MIFCFPQVTKLLKKSIVPKENREDPCWKGWALSLKIFQFPGGKNSTEESTYSSNWRYFLVSFWIKSLLITELTSIFHQQGIAYISANIHCQITVTVFHWMKHKEVKKHLCETQTVELTSRGWRGDSSASAWGSSTTRCSWGARGKQKAIRTEERLLPKISGFLFVCLMGHGVQCVHQRG